MPLTSLVLTRRRWGWRIREALCLRHLRQQRPSPAFSGHVATVTSATRPSGRKRLFGGLLACPDGRAYQDTGALYVYDAS